MRERSFVFLIAIFFATTGAAQDDRAVSQRPSAIPKEQSQHRKCTLALGETYLPSGTTPTETPPGLEGLRPQVSLEKLPERLSKFLEYLDRGYQESLGRSQDRKISEDNKIVLHKGAIHNIKEALCTCLKVRNIEAAVQNAFEQINVLLKSRKEKEISLRDCENLISKL